MTFMSQRVAWQIYGAQTGIIADLWCKW
jgi:hypothetical protein